MSDEPISALSVIGHMNGCSMWRTIWPVLGLKRAGYPAEWTYLPVTDEGWLQTTRYQAVICNRFHFRSVVTPDQPLSVTLGQALERRTMMHANGTVMLGEFDDDLWLARDEQKSEIELGISQRNNTLDESVASVKVFDGVTVTNARLASTLNSVAPELAVEVVPNSIDLDYWKWCLDAWPHGRPLEIPEGAVTVGWAGGDRYDRDIEPLAEAWRRLASRFPDIHFILMGHQAQPLVDAVPATRLHQIEWMPLTPEQDKPAYPVGLSTMDICCCSVAPTRFNGCKTPIRVFEATASGAAVVVSRWLYGTVVDHEVDGYIADSVDDWVRFVGKLVKARARRRQFQHRMMQKVRREYSLEANLWRWPAAWTNLYEQAKDRLFRGLVFTGASVDHVPG